MAVGLAVNAIGLMLFHEHGHGHSHVGSNGHKDNHGNTEHVTKNVENENVQISIQSESRREGESHKTVDHAIDEGEYYGGPCHVFFSLIRFLFLLVDHSGTNDFSDNFASRK